MTSPKSGRSHAEHKILSQILNGVAASSPFKEELRFLKDDTDSKLTMYIIDYYRTHITLAAVELLDVTRKKGIKALFLEIVNWELAREDVDMVVPQEAIAKRESYFLDDKMQLLNKKIRSVGDPMEKAELAVEKNQLIEEREEWRSVERK